MAPKKKENTEEKYDLELRFGRSGNNLKMGIVGLPNVGKSSFFNLMTKQTADAANFPFCTIEPNKGRVQVPDVRYDKLCEMWKPPSEHPSYLNLVDIAGLVRGASKGEGLGNEFLTNIQQVDGIFHMVRIFESDEVTHVDDSVDPVRDLDTITAELCLKDLAALEKQVAYEHTQAKKANKVMPPIFVNTMAKIKDCLEKNLILSKQTWTTIEVQKINEFLPMLITTKPVVYLLNMTAKGYLTKKNKWLLPVHKWIQEHGGGAMIPLSVEFEERMFENQENIPFEIETIKKELGELKSKNPKTGEVTITDKDGLSYASNLPKIINTGFKDLNLIQFFTTGPTEVRSWTVFKGATAPNAAGVIHGDMEKCFIKAEVCAYEDFVANTPEGQKSMAGVKAAGKYRQEGKTYVVNDGDILHIMHNARK